MMVWEIGGWALAGVALALVLGGVTKGATGAGMPILPVPILALLVDLRFAIVLMVAPSLLSNIWQFAVYRRHLPPRSLWRPLLLASALGVIAGTFLLASLPLRLLPVVLSGAVLAYVALRIARPGLALPMRAAERMAAPVGLLAGMLQGMTGISAPVSITFLSSIRMERAAFVATISLVFVVFSVFQLPLLLWTGLATPGEAMLGLVALVPISLGIVLGDRLARRLPRAVFDRMILGMLLVLSARLMWEFAAG